MMSVLVVRDYLNLCKPRVVLLMLVTAWVGMHLASGATVCWATVWFASIGIAFVAGSAAVINHIVDRKIDSIMRRTAKRPIASGRIAWWQAVLFAAILGCSGFWCLLVYVNALTAGLTLLTFLGYAFFYTIFLKRATPQNIVIGGVPGAMPPLLGWTAITGSISPFALLMVLLIFTWTAPHFWALAINRCTEYQQAEIPMLPVTHGIKFTSLYILLYVILLCPVSILPFVFGMSGILYLLASIPINIIFIRYAIALYKSQDKQLALRTFNYSIVYLLLIFMFLLIDNYLHITTLNFLRL